jgi:hypothetical protein
MSKASPIKFFDGGLTKSATRLSIGIDQSYTGFAFTIMDMDTGEWMTTVSKAPGSHVDRLFWIGSNLQNSLQTLAKDAETIVVAMEGYAFGSQMANMAGELGGLVKLTCYMELDKFDGKYPYIIPPTTLKKYVTGKGTGIQKNQILLHVFKKWGVEFNDDNAADSYALAHLASGKAELAYEKEIYQKIQGPNYREKP